MMVGIGAIGSGLMYGFLYIIPIKPFIWIFERYSQYSCVATGVPNNGSVNHVAILEIKKLWSHIVPVMGIMKN